MTKILGMQGDIFSIGELFYWELLVETDRGTASIQSPSPYSNEPLAESGLRRAMEELCEAAGISTELQKHKTTAVMFPPNGNLH